MHKISSQLPQIMAVFITFYRQPFLISTTLRSWMTSFMPFYLTSDASKGQIFSFCFIIAFFGSHRGYMTKLLRCSNTGITTTVISIKSQQKKSWHFTRGEISFNKSDIDSEGYFSFPRQMIKNQADFNDMCKGLITNLRFSSMIWADPPTRICHFVSNSNGRLIQTCLDWLGRIVGFCVQSRSLKKTRFSTAFSPSHSSSWKE